MSSIIDCWGVRTKAFEIMLDEFVEQRSHGGVTPDFYRVNGYEFSLIEYTQAVNVQSYFKSVWFDEGTLTLDEFLTHLENLEDEYAFYQQDEDILVLESVIMDLQEYILEQASDLFLIVSEKFKQEDYRWHNSTWPQF